MKNFRTLLLLAAALLFGSPAYATTLASLAITTAQAGAVTTPVQMKDSSPDDAAIQCKFTYGSGGTSADVWVQTSFDGGTTWTDVAECGFTTSSATKGYNLSSQTPVTTVYPFTDGTLAANTAKDGLLGTKFRVKYTIVGTYASGTTLTVDATFGNTRSQP